MTKRQAQNQRTTKGLRQMANLKVCDVLGHKGGPDVKTYIVEVRVAGGDEHQFEARVDLCPKGLERLRHFLVRGTTPKPGKAGGDE